MENLPSRTKDDVHQHNTHKRGKHKNKKLTKGVGERAAGHQHYAQGLKETQEQQQKTWDSRGWLVTWCIKPSQQQKKDCIRAAIAVEKMSI